MTTFLLIRHGSNDYLGKAIPARLPNVHLNEQGRREADALVGFLARMPINRIYSSPMERTVETAQPLARARGIELQIASEIIEIDFGEWSGATLEELERKPEWKLWNSFRSGTRLPGGESMLDCQVRMREFIERTRREFAGQTIAIFSHGDPIRAALLYYLGMPLDFCSRLEISPASVSILKITDGWIEVTGLNLRPNFT